MNLQDHIKTRFAQLAEQADQIPVKVGEPGWSRADEQKFYAWALSSLNLIKGVFGKDSPHYERLYAEVSQTKEHFIRSAQT